MTTPEKKKKWQPKRADWRAGGEGGDDTLKQDRMAEVEALTSEVDAKDRAGGFSNGRSCRHPPQLVMQCAGHLSLETHTALSQH